MAVKILNVLEAREKKSKETLRIEFLTSKAMIEHVIAHMREWDWFIMSHPRVEVVQS